MKISRRVFVVDDHSIVGRGLRDLVGSLGLEWCGEATDARSALIAIRQTVPDLVILDISLGGQSGLDLLRDMLADDPDRRVLVFSMHDEALYATRVLGLGASGYVMKHAPTADIEAAILAVIDGRIWVSQKMNQRVLGRISGRHDDVRSSPLDLLSVRELEVFELIGRGVRTRAIAEELCLSVKTIESHRANIKNKLGLESGAELVQRAVAWVQRL